jgi:hypothetical protein
LLLASFNSLETYFLFTDNFDLVGTKLIITMTQNNSVNETIGCRLEEPGFSLRNGIETGFMAHPVNGK